MFQLQSKVQSKNAAHFVYLAWGTEGGEPVLGCDQVRQAAYLAIIVRSRSRFCHVIAIGGTAGRIHVIVRFPPSLSISTVARMVREAGGAAIACQSQTMHGHPIFQSRLWEKHYTSHTLREMNAAEADAYVQRQIVADDSRWIGIGRNVYAAGENLRLPFD